MTKKRVLSGAQPTGDLHIGNWLGAIRNWVDLQNDHESFFCVVDLHAITVPHDPKKLSQNINSTAGLYLACGLDPEKSKLFVQSHISAHSELCWILNCLTPLNWMERMIQFKEKSLKQGENVSIGLLDYPVLMAADILLYDADLVPVGEDQKQHLELARNIAQQRVNAKFGSKKVDILKVPKALILKEGAKVMSLTNGLNKMSKSDPNENSRISLLDPPEIISKKIKKAKTDAEIGLSFSDSRPEANNLLSLYSVLSRKSRNDVAKEFKEIGWGKFKPILTEVIISSLLPIQENYNNIIKEPDYIKNILDKGATNAEEVANTTLNRVKKAIGLI